VKRYKIQYNDKYLKIETSFRDNIDLSDINNINNINVYKISKLIDMKLDAIDGRTKGRDFHDLVFILDKFFDSFTIEQINKIKNIYNNKYDYMSRYEPAYKEDSYLKKLLYLDFGKFEELVEDKIIKSIIDIENVFFNPGD
jgi:predicted nucleotidyltransferase component of viral defense system